MNTQAAIATNEIRKELKAKFPGMNFKVTSKTYSGGNSINISYDNGPTVREVEEITSKYCCGSFDVMTDIYEYSNGFDYSKGYAKYIFVERNISPEIFNTIYKEMWGEDYNAQDWKNRDKRSICYRDKIDNISMYVMPETKKRVVTSSKPFETPEGVSVEIIYNDEKGGIELKFSSKPSAEIIEEMKVYGFRWNFKTSLWWAKRSERTEDAAKRIVEKMK